jgi:tetratricopeptide (TPR) repeat protein
MRTIQDLVEKYKRDGLQETSCYFHEQTVPQTVCRKCGKDLCAECTLPQWNGNLCRECVNPLLSRLSFLRPFISNPGIVLACTIIIFGVLYALFGSGQNVRLLSPSVKDLHKDEVALRNWLFTSKGVRLLNYAEYLEKEQKTSKAQRVYGRARRAFEQILISYKISTETASAKADPLLDIKIRDRIGRVLIIVADCLIKQEDIDPAFKTLSGVLAFKPGAMVQGHAHFKLAMLFEEEKKDLRQAIAHYTEARKIGSVPFGDFLEGTIDSVIDMMSKPMNERNLDLVLQAVTKTFDPAEAQYRIIICFDKLKDRKNVLLEYQRLLKDFPFSDWSRKLTESGVIKEQHSRKRAEELFPDSSDSREKEKLTITPIEED